MKVCSKCLIEKSKDCYHKRSNRPCGVRSICKDCYKLYPKQNKRSDGYSRKYDLFKSYSLTVEEFNFMLLSQDNKCKICGIDASTLNGRKKHFCVDHNHKNGEIRGLLCDKCNRGIGLLNEDI